MPDDVVLSSGAGIGRIALARPSKKNALTTAMYAEMAAALERYARDDEVRVVLIAGGDDFTAGNDLQDFMMASMGGAAFADLPVVRFLQRLSTFEKPVVVAVRGVAVGIGTTLLLHADLVVAGRSARFRLPFTPLGLVPEAASTLLLPLAVGRARAAKLLLLGDFFGAEAALAMGLISELVDDDAADNTAVDLAARLAELPSEAVRETKRLLRAPWAAQIAAQMEAETTAFAQRLASDEFRAAAMKLLAR